MGNYKRRQKQRIKEKRNSRRKNKLREIRDKEYKPKNKVEAIITKVINSIIKLMYLDSQV